MTAQTSELGLQQEVRCSIPEQLSPVLTYGRVGILCELFVLDERVHTHVRNNNLCHSRLMRKLHSNNRLSESKGAALRLHH